MIMKIEATKLGTVRWPRSLQAGFCYAKRVPNFKEIAFYRGFFFAVGFVFFAIRIWLWRVEVE